MANPEHSFTSRIEQLQSENCKLTIKLDIANGRTMEETRLKEMATAETRRLRAIVQAAETDKQLLQKEVQKLQGTLDFWKHTTSESVTEFLHRLRLDLSLPISG